MVAIQKILFHFHSSVILLALLVITTCAQASDHKPLIVTSMKPIASIIEHLAGDHAETVYLFEGTESIHHAYLKPSQMRKLAEADLIILIQSDHFELTLGHALKGNEQNVVNIADALGEDLLPNRVINNDHHAHKHHYHDNNRNHEYKKEHAYDYHVWGDINNMIVVSEYIAKQLMALMPEHENEIRSNLIYTQFKLKDLKHDMKRLKKAIKPQLYVIWHDSVQYLESSWNLKNPIIIASSHADSISMNRVKQVRKQIREHAVRCIIKGTDFNEKMVQLLTEDMQHAISVVPMDIKGALIPYTRNHYFDLMLEISQKMTICLR